MKARMAALAVAVVMVAACGDDGGVSIVTDGTDRTTTAAVTTAAPTTGATTTEPVPTAPATTPAPPTTGAATTAAPTTSPGPTTTPEPTVAPTVPLPPGTWVRADDFPAWSVSPCCASEWPVTEESPALPPPSGTLADGLYPATVANGGWSPFVPAELRLRVSRFERCGEDPGTRIWCETGEPDEIGVVRTEAVEMTFPLDTWLSVGLTGWSCEADATRWRSDGTGLLRLWEALNSDFDETIRIPVLDGASVDDVLAGLVGSAGPFVADPCPDVGGYGVVWTSDTGPSVLFQGVVDFDSGQPLAEWSLLSGVTLEVRDGRTTLYLQRTWMP